MMENTHSGTGTTSEQLRKYTNDFSTGGKSTNDKAEDPLVQALHTCTTLRPMDSPPQLKDARCSKMPSKGLDFQAQVEK